LYAYANLCSTAEGRSAERIPPEPSLERGQCNLYLKGRSVIPSCSLHCIASLVRHLAVGREDTYACNKY